MCLYIGDDSTKLKRKVRKEGKKIIAYKALDVRGGRLFAPYRGDKWSRHEAMVSDRKGKDPSRLTKQEGEYGYVNKGLHFYRTLEDAKSFNRHSHRSTYEVEINPQDIVAFSSKTLVAHKAKIVKLVRKSRKR